MRLFIFFLNEYSAKNSFYFFCLNADTENFFDMSMFTMDGFHNLFFYYYFFFGELECVGYSFVYDANFVFLRDFWIRSFRTQRAVVASRRAPNLATHFPNVFHFDPYFEGVMLILFKLCLFKGFWFY
jgi:hypothetical protein